MDEIKNLIDTFKGYRDLLTPIQVNLQDFAETYKALQNDIGELNSAFEGNMPEKLESIYKDLSKEAQKAVELSQRIDRFISLTTKFSADFNKMSDTFTKLEEKLKFITDIESKAETQLEKLDVLLEEKKKTYDIKSLEKTIEVYNANVQAVSEYINKDIASVLEKTGGEIKSIKNGTGDIAKSLETHNSSVEKLIAEYTATNTFLKQLVERETVNEEYIFDILDKWAGRKK